ncbi:DNA-directed RNA polymerase subunit delta [Spiroplasma endosymbiont of Polydrusus pterygomalis]|uniref:DNA-directed RNA polymerase subunit delta n=1 Tax=Spiroplasma endosymbiont of Polydrusus pterygomalis TaxID=3139327 RepID=UPI003CCA7969
MESKQTLVEIAYNFLCKKKKSSFNEIWTHVKKQCNIAKEDEEKVAGELYTGIILNTNFFLKNDKFWYPRSEVSLEEIKEQHMIRVKNNKEEIDSTETFADDETTNLIDESDNEEDDLDTINIQPLEDSYDDE